jgi:hypothetical protein
MRRFIFALLLSGLSMAFFAQEVVVFKDYRSLPVLSHRVDGDWTYFRLQGGELAVLSSSILEIRKEPARAQSASPIRPSSPYPEGRPHPGLRPEINRTPQSPVQYQPPAPAPEQPPSYNKPDEDEEDESTTMDDDSDDDEADENEPVINKPPEPPIRPVGIPQQPEEPANADEK